MLNIRRRIGRSVGIRLFATAPAAPTVENISLISSPDYIIPHQSVLVSGIQPTGAFHIGNYFGATKNWRDLAQRIKNDQIDSKMLLFVADLHSLTMPQDYSKLHQQRLEAYASILACGINPDDVTVFCQSDVPEHTQLMWILGCFTGMGYLNRMTQWKSKANLATDSSIQKDLGKVQLGLFTYPVLMAADVLLFGATHVPVGLDQAQHLELTRDLAIAFNKQTKSRILTIPKTLLTPSNKITSLRNPLKKMSKSDPDKMAKLLMTEDPKSIASKINKTVTDSIEGKITYDPANRPGIANLINIYSAISHVTPDQAADQVQDLTKKQLKELVAEALIKELKEPNLLYNELIKNEDRLNALRLQGRDKAREIASRNLKEVYKVVGMA